MNKFIKWFNNSNFLSWFFTPLRIKRFWRGYQRVRICERCFDATTDIHWCREDILLADRVEYGYIYKCDYCFYGIERE